MTYFSDIQAYIEDLARKHKKLMHEDGGIAFIPMEISEDGVSMLKTKKNYIKIMGTSAAQRNESQLLWLLRIRFLVNVSLTAPKLSEISAASNTAFEILSDFDARIKNEVETTCTFIDSLLAPNIEAVGLTDQSAMGWDYTLRFVTAISTYNANAWEG